MNLNTIIHPLRLVAEKATELSKRELEREGNLGAKIHSLTEDGEIIVTFIRTPPGVNPIGAFPSLEQWVHEYNRACRARGAAAIVGNVATLEVWFLKVPAGAPLPEETPSEHAQRQEALLISCCDHHGNFTVALHPFERAADGAVVWGEVTEGMDGAGDGIFNPWRDVAPGPQA